MTIPKEIRAGASGWFRVAALVLVAAPLLAGCERKTAEKAPEPRPVRTIIAAREPATESIVLTGQIEAQNEAAMAFRISGRMVERPVNVGDTVTAGQLLAKLDPVNELNALRSAQAAVAAAQSQLTTATNAFGRQQHLLGNGFTTRANFEQAQKTMETAQAQLDDAEAQLEVAHDRVSFTELHADVDGTITARGAEPGEVVQAGQMIVQLARRDGRDAVFDVPAQVLRSAPSDPEVLIRLADDPSVTATGRVREVAPQANPQTRTFPVRVGINNPPMALRLGSTVTGTLKLDTSPVMAIPASALTASGQDPAVWVVDPEKLTVSLRPIEIVRHDPASVIVSHGIDTGEIIVTAGVQALHPDQQVRLVGSNP